MKNAKVIYKTMVHLQLALVTNNHWGNNGNFVSFDQNGNLKQLTGSFGLS